MASTDPRLAALYDLDNPAGQDHEWFRSLADRIGARTIVDLGCGTGLLTVTFAAAERRVIGIDPDVGMLAIARSRTGGHRVEWVVGDSTAIGFPKADLVVMSGNVAQHIGPDDWERTLANVHDALRPGGYVAFESRNPLARAWLNWTRDKTFGTRSTASGALTEWMDVSEVNGEAVTFEAHNIFEATGEHVISAQTLIFRSVEEITADLAAAGLSIEHVFGGWNDEPLTSESHLLVFKAFRP